MRVAVLVAAFGATVATAAAAALPRAAPGDSPPGAGSAIHEPILPGLPFRLPTGRRDPVRGEAGAPPSPLSAEPAWTPLTITPRSGHAAVYDPVRRRMLVLGGTDCWEFHNSVTALSLSGSPSWRALLPGGGPPAGRDQTIAVYDSRSQSLRRGRWSRNPGRPLDGPTPRSTTRSATASSSPVAGAWIHPGISVNPPRPSPTSGSFPVEGRHGGS